MENLRLSILTDVNAERTNRFRSRHLDFLEENESLEATSSALRNSIAIPRSTNKGKRVTSLTHFPNTEDRPPSLLPPPTPSSPPPSSSPPPGPFRGSTVPTISKYVDAPADERDDIIAALAWEQQHERHLKAKARWEMNDEYLEELDSIAPTMLYDTFHEPIVALSEKYFSKVSWRLLASRITNRTKGLTEARKYFPAFVKLPCIPETWDTLAAHSSMSSPLFIEAIISNTLATQMCHCPALQAEGDLAAYLDTFYYQCMSIGPGTLDAAEWMAVTLQMMHKMLYPDRTNPRYKYQAKIPEVKPIEESAQTRDIVWALCDTLRLLRAAVGAPLSTSESEDLLKSMTDIVVKNFKLSVEWHMKPLAFRQQGPAWHLRQSVEPKSGMYDFDDPEAFLNDEPVDPTVIHHVIAVISPTLLREEWDKPDNPWWQGKVWMKPRLLIAPGPPPK
ncbi:hypothetical protein Dda_1533 [Drechslerella dactyloides]|uniref:Uncharacterized protein n=1 Tax=Drechslerella dactyloides TaxID=74499 RepID=A0AAD6NM28_DREDA|nr:hypothetical protein Dda_1533 [Drechslerella dactyloides]